MKTVIFTDLDGTLLDPKTYSFDEARLALDEVRKRNIPLVLCSSKTRAEIEVYRKDLQNSDPFIVENGAATFIPAGYFKQPTGGVVREDYVVTTFGTPYRVVREALVRLRESMGIAVKGFGDMTVEEIAALTELSQDEAALARIREFDEPFIFKSEPDERFLRAIEEVGLHWTRGRLYHIMGDHDKGKAVRLLKRWYESERGKLVTIGLGDGFNDLPLLAAVDHPVLIRKEDGSFDPRVDFPGLIKAKGIGPEGWNRAVLELLSQNTIIIKPS
ncbi:MAG TPA: HAD-IIB family hydrolase [Nitrospirota bacterium]|nr:HAD-IIB family hydrolase [Nitrospirota bacterium]